MCRTRILLPKCNEFIVDIIRTLVIVQFNKVLLISVGNSLRKLTDKMCVQEAGKDSHSTRRQLFRALTRTISGDDEAFHLRRYD